MFTKLSLYVAKLCLWMAIGKKIPANRKHRSKPLPSSFNKILLVGTGRLGDLIMTLPLVVALKEKYPSTHIIYMCRSGNEKILELSPFVEAIHIAAEKGWQKLAEIKKLRALDCDLSINFCESKLNGLIFATGIPIRIGFCQRHVTRDRWLLTHPLLFNRPFPGTTELFLELLSPLGIRNIPSTPSLQAEANVIEDVKARFDLPVFHPIIVIHAGTTEKMKQWPFFVALIDQILKKYTCTVVLTGVASERPLCESILKEFPTVIDAIGKTSLKELTALLQIAHLVIGNDTGPLHLARAVGTQTVTIFGPSSPQIFHPSCKDLSVAIDIDCRPETDRFMGVSVKNLKRCRLSHCDHHSCMRHILPEQVMEKIQILLG